MRKPLTVSFENEGSRSLKKRYRFAIMLCPALLLKFAAAGDSFSFLWFAVLYLPTINWSTYWLFCVVRLGVNRLAGREAVTFSRIRYLFVWYLILPGALVLSEIIYQGYRYYS